MRAGAPAPQRLAGGPYSKSLAPAHVLSTCAGSSRPALAGARAQRGGYHRLTAIAAASSKDAPAPLVSYTVQKGETLWDVAVQHGVSMRTVKDLNKLSGSEPVLTEGQQLLVPASGITAVATADAAASTAALGSTPARGLWVGSEHVRLATVEEAKQLYRRQCDRGNSQNTLLVLYAPWCPHCRDIEDELERLAEGLSHVPAVRVVAVNGDSADGRLFAREVLGVAYYPSIISFPEHNRTFFKYKGRHRDAESLLRFLNMTCCAREDQMWLLRPTGTTSMAVAGGKGGPLKWVSHWAPVGTSPTAMMTAVGFLALVLAAAGFWAVRRRRGVEPEVVAELDSSLGRMAQLMMRAVATRLALLVGWVGPPEGGAGDGATAAATVAAGGGEGPPSADAAAPPPARAPSEAEVTAAERQRRHQAGSPSASPPSSPLASPIASLDHNTAPVSPSPNPNPSPKPNPSPALMAASSALDSSRVRAADPLGGLDSDAAAAAGPSTAAVVAAAAVTDVAVAAPANGVVSEAGEVAAPGPAAGLVSEAVGVAAGARALTADERMRLTRLTDDELIALVNSDPDLDKVLSRLLGDK